MDLSHLWTQALQGLQQQIGRRDLEVWFSGSRPIKFDGELFVLELPNQYYIDWIADNYTDPLIGQLRAISGKQVQLELIARDDLTTSEVPFEASGGSEPAEPRAIGVNFTQTFDAFVVGECNKFAHAAARAVAESPARSYNPLFIYGATGLGKTHLMHAIANEILSQDPAARVVYVTAEEFMNEMILSIRNRTNEQFRSKYRKQATVLLVDDIQFLSGKDRTQEEFFHTFNALQALDRQIVITSDVVPKDIEKLEPRLRTRFEGGLLADMQAPDKETLIAILYQKADALRLNVPPEVADAMAQRVAGNIRELEGILNRLAALHSFFHEPITLEFVRKKLPSLFSQVTTQVTVAAIIEAVARFHNLRSADLTGDRRTRTLTRPRHIAMYLARKHTNLSFPELGREFGGRDHSTIQHGYHRVEEELVEDPDVAYRLRLIEQSLHLRQSS